MHYIGGGECRNSAGKFPPREIFKGWRSCYGTPVPDRLAVCSAAVRLCFLGTNVNKFLFTAAAQL